MRSFTGRPSVVVALRCGAVIAALVAAWGPHVGAADGVARVVLFDVSASADTSAVTMADLVEGVGGGDTFRIVPFAGHAETLPRVGAAPVPTADDAALLHAARSVRINPHGSDLAVGLRRAAAIATEGRRMEIVIVSDLHSTSAQEELVRAAAAIGAAGGADIRALVTPTRSLEPRVMGLTGPGRVVPGEVYSLFATGDAGPRGGRLQLVSNGHVRDARDVPPGPFRVRFSVRAPAGRMPLNVDLPIHQVQFAGVEDRPAPRARPVVTEAGVPLFLFGSAEPTPPASALESAISAQRVRVSSIEGDWQAGLEAHDLVVVVGGPLRPRDRAVLGAWVEGGGGALLVGDVAWAGVSPLRTSPPDDPGAFLYVALDGSGSMGELWRGGDTQTRDAVVRAALRELASAASADTTVVLRRFNDRLLPDGGRPWVGRPGGSDRAAFDTALTALPSPAGGTLLVPALEEAARLAATRTERARRAIVFSDGRFGDDADVLRGAVASVTGRGCGLTLVVDDERGLSALSAALEGTPAEIVLVTESSRVSSVLHAAAARARPDSTLDYDVALRAGPHAAEVLGLTFPERASAVLLRWAAPDAAVMIETADSAPVAAVRAHGLGRVAALATPGGREWPTEADARLLVVLRGLAERAPDADVQVERDGDRLLIRAVGEARPASIHAHSGEEGGYSWRTGVERVGRDLYAADLPHDGRSWAALVLDAAGARLARVGIDGPAAPEYRGPPRTEIEALRDLAAGPGGAPGAPLRPWLAALAVLLAVTAHLVTARRLSSR